MQKISRPNVVGLKKQNATLKTDIANPALIRILKYSKQNIQSIGTKNPAPNKLNEDLGPKTLLLLSL